MLSKDIAGKQLRTNIFLCSRSDIPSTFSALETLLLENSNAWPRASSQFPTTSYSLCILSDRSTGFGLGLYFWSSWLEKWQSWGNGRWWLGGCLFQVMVANRISTSDDKFPEYTLCYSVVSFPIIRSQHIPTFLIVFSTGTQTFDKQAMPSSTPLLLQACKGLMKW